MSTLLTHLLSWSLLGLWLGGTAALAQSADGKVQAQVALVGVLGGKALLVIDGAPPKSVAVGDSYRGVKVLSTGADVAEVEVQGQRQTLRLGAGPVAAAPGLATSDDQRRRIVLQAGSNGHFQTLGQINGKTVNFMVDTGASVIGLSASEADKLGLSYKDGTQVMVHTANGHTVGWRTRLGSVRLGSVEVFEVEALVTPGAMPFVLLGNSYLARFHMTRNNDQLVLVQRY